MTEKIRLAKILANNGYGSRRKIEEMIEQNRIKINDRLAIQGDKVDLDLDQVFIDGTKARLDKNQMTIILNKPKNVLTSMKKTDDRLCLLDILDEKYHTLHHVGRLDYDSQGLLILTNDGDFTQKIAHPSKKIPKTYLVLITPAIDKNGLKKLKDGVQIKEVFFNDDHKNSKAKKETKTFISSFDSVKILESSDQESLLEVVIHSGKNRIIRKTLDAIGFKVKDLVRIKIGPLKLAELKLGKVRHLSDQEIQSLIKVP